MTESDCAARLVTALEDESPNARREAIIHVSDSPHVSNTVVVRALARVAQDDPAESVRYVAVRALGKAGTIGSVDPLLDIVAAAYEPAAQRGARPGEVRRAALDELDAMLEEGLLSAPQQERCGQAAVYLLDNHRSRDVRVSSARIMRHFAEDDVLTALIGGLSQRDFGVGYHCHRSLMHLTGQTIDLDASAWRKWRAEADDPFAQRGMLDDELYVEEEDWWDRTVRGTRETFAGFRHK